MRVGSRQITWFHCSVVIISLQWLLVYFLIVSLHQHQSYQHNAVGSSSLAVANERSVDAVRDKAISVPDDPVATTAIGVENIDVGATITNTTARCEGVAVTMLLGSPKWYARRFTFTVHNALSVLPPTWCVQILVADPWSRESLDVNVGLRRTLSNNFNGGARRVFLTTIPKELTSKYKKRRYRYLKNPWLWRSLRADRALLFDGNGAFCANSNATLSDFDEFDYVGSPWGSHGGRGGSGEFSVRSRAAMLRALELVADNDEGEREDAFFVRALTTLNEQRGNAASPRYVLATPKDVERFGGTRAFQETFEQHAARKSWHEVGPPFAARGTFPRLSWDQRDALLSLCPELKIIFPSLHDPHCFGARPNSTACAKTICALKDPRERPSGC